MGLRDFLNKPAPQWAQRFAQSLPSTRNFASALENTPKASANFKNPIARGAANIALDSTVNIPSNLLRSWGKTVGGFENKAPVGQQLGNVGEIGFRLASLLPIVKTVGAFKGAGTALGNSIRNRTRGQITKERIPEHLIGDRKIFNAERPLPDGYVRTGKSNSPVAYEFGGVQPREVPGVYGMRKLAAQEVERGRLSPTLTDWGKGLIESMPRISKKKAHKK